MRRVKRVENGARSREREREIVRYTREKERESGQTRGGGYTRGGMGKVGMEEEEEEEEERRF